MIDTERKELCIELYKAGDLSVKEIMARTGIRSSQSVYRIITEAGLALQRGNVAHKASITFDEETWQIIERKQPRNLSKFVCKAIKQTYKRKND